MTRYLAAEKVQVDDVLASPNAGETVTGVFYPVRGDMVEIITELNGGFNRLVFKAGHMIGLREDNR